MYFSLSILLNWQPVSSVFQMDKDNSEKDQVGNWKDGLKPLSLESVAWRLCNGTNADSRHWVQNN